MTDIPTLKTTKKFTEFTEDGSAPQKYLHVVTDPEYTTPGRVLIGLAYHGEYQNISVSDEMALKFAEAVLLAAADSRLDDLHARADRLLKLYGVEENER